MAAERPFGSEAGGFGRRLNPDTLLADKGLGDLSVERSSVDAGDQRRILEMLAYLGERREEKKKLPSEDVNTSNGWEPILSEPDPENQRFIVTYSGPYAQRLEINRKNAERLIGISALDGNVVLCDLPESRARQIAGVNSDGSVARKRGLFFGERVKDVEDVDYSLVTQIPVGWMISLGGEAIFREEMEKSSNKSLEQRFVGRLNEELGSSLIKILGKDKFELSSFGDKNRLLWTLVYPTLAISETLPDGFQPGDLGYLLVVAAAYSLANSLSRFFYARGPASVPILRKSLNSAYEYFMPPTEIDRYLRGVAFLNMKGRNLVRLAKDNQGSR